MDETYSIVVVFAGVWFTYLLARIAAGTEAIANELRRIRELAERGRK